MNSIPNLQARKNVILRFILHEDEESDDDEWSKQVEQIRQQNLDFLKSSGILKAKGDFKKNFQQEPKKQRKKGFKKASMQPQRQSDRLLQQRLKDKGSISPTDRTAGAGTSGSATPSAVSLDALKELQGIMSSIGNQMNSRFEDLEEKQNDILSKIEIMSQEMQFIYRTMKKIDGVTDEEGDKDEASPKLSQEQECSEAEVVSKKRKLDGDEDEDANIFLKYGPWLKMLNKKFTKAEASAIKAKQVKFRFATSQMLLNDGGLLKKPLTTIANQLFGTLSETNEAKKWTKLGVFQSFLEREGGVPKLAPGVPGFWRRIESCDWNDELEERLNQYRNAS